MTVSFGPGLPGAVFEAGDEVPDLRGDASGAEASALIAFGNRWNRPAPDLLEPADRLAAILNSRRRDRRLSRVTHKQVIDNSRVQLADTLREVAKDFKQLSIATGYWDLPGTQEILDAVKDYEKIRLVIGQEPLSPRNAKNLKIEIPEPGFPDQDFTFDLTQLDDDDLRATVVAIKDLIADGKLEVRVYRRSFLHAKTYIFGDYASDGAVGIIGSSNFTKAGLTTNTELNALEDNHMVVKFQPHAETDEHGHLSWFDGLWNDELTENWDGRFTEMLRNSPVGDLTFGAYDTYIKTLMEVYPDELLPPEILAPDIKDVLFSFQYRNAQILINKLERMGLAMLSDSVGLGKTITSGAVINHYKQKDATRIYVIAPASLKSQWVQDLAERFGLVQGYEVISLQDAGAIDRARGLDQYKSVDLFVVDEAHNLRNASGKRHQQLLEWFIANPTSKVLLLTATPINNSLMDFVNQIQLASKGSLESISVDYRDENGKLQKIDFFYALAQIQSRIRRAEKQGQPFDWNAISAVVGSGLRHYLVRTTRQGVKQMGGIVLPDGSRHDFPESVVEQIGYHYSNDAQKAVGATITAAMSTFEGYDPRKLDIDALLDQTQRSEHPLDTLPKGGVPNTDDYIGNVFANIFQIVLLLGFTPYRPEIYQHRIHGKSVDDIRSLGLKGDESFRIQTQLAIHNLLRVSWLKRLESSQSALRKSIGNYLVRLERFENFLANGKILSFKEIDAVIAEYGEDVEIATLDPGAFTDADPAIYDIDAMKDDIIRDRAIAARLNEILNSIAGHDDKLDSFAAFLNNTATSNDSANKKVLVFSYFSDTINYLQEALPPLMKDKSFRDRAAFVVGGMSGIDQITGRFAPKAKKYKLKDGESELEYLFATDVLSEGQNLQDAGCLVNYDLHWNPVRMIQRNGRINRLGSEFVDVYVWNMKPEDNLEAYLKLLNRLNRKINTIRHTIGLDQDVLEKGQVNAKEFVEHYDESDLLKILEVEEEGDDAAEEATEFDTADLYGSNASEALEHLEEEEDKFFVEDDFIYDLRAFLAANADSPGEVSRVEAIPLGKWGYLPNGTTLESAGHVLGLAKAHGRTTMTGTEVGDTHFVVVDTSAAAYRTLSIEDTEALKRLHADPGDNARRPDMISVNRSLVARRVKAAAKAQVGRSVVGYSPKPSELEGLGYFEAVLPGRGLLKLVTTRVTTKKEVRDLQALSRKARSEMKRHGQLLGATIAAMDSLSTALVEKQIEDTQIDEVTGVLFYAQQ
jgi:superfamily II DNA or RNA helicase